MKGLASPSKGRRMLTPKACSRPAPSRPAAMMPGPAPVTTIPSAAASLAAQGAGEDVDRVVGLRAGRTEHGDLAYVTVGAEHPEGLGHLGQGRVGDLEVAHRRDLAGQVAERPDHVPPVPGL